MNLKHATEKLVIWLTAGVSVGVSILHILGVFEGSSWLSEHVPVLTLLLVAGLLPLLLNILEKNIESLKADLKISELSTFLEGMDPNLRLVFGELVADQLASVYIALRERRVQFHDVELFRHFYRRVLDTFPKATLFATSLPLPCYFWRINKLKEIWQISSLTKERLSGCFS